MERRGERGKQEKEERRGVAKDGGDAWEAWKSPHGQITLSVDLLTAPYFQASKVSQSKLTYGGSRHPSGPG